MNKHATLNVSAIQFSLEYHALEIYLAGCLPPHCPGCHNEELWNFERGAVLAEWENRIRSFALEYGGDIPLIQNVFILGGEPLDQYLVKLHGLLGFVREVFPRTRLWLWTRYEIDYVPHYIAGLCDYIKTGRYDNTRPPVTVNAGGYRFTLASDNQQFHSVRG